MGSGNVFFGAPHNSDPAIWYRYTWVASRRLAHCCDSFLHPKHCSNTQGSTVFGLQVFRVYGCFGRIAGPVPLQTGSVVFTGPVGLSTLLITLQGYGLDNLDWGTYSTTPNTRFLRKRFRRCHKAVRIHRIPRGMAASNVCLELLGF